jgi:hypothetical protein
VYHPAFEPTPGGASYLEWIEEQPRQEILTDLSGLMTEAEWLANGPALGKDVFEAPITDDRNPFGRIVRIQDVRNPAWYLRTGVPYGEDGVVPFVRYVVTDTGVRVGSLSCAMCHTRVMKSDAGKTVVLQGAQGNFPFDRVIGNLVRDTAVQDPKAALDTERELFQLLFLAPWLSPDPLKPVMEAGLQVVIAMYESIPAGALARHGASVLSPVQIPDLIGVRDRRYLDRTGLVRHRDAADLMRYAALNQGADLLNRYGTFIPGGKDGRALPPPEAVVQGRYSDEQLYALALFVYSLEPPPNPHRPRTKTETDLVARGERLFAREGCASCHTPPAYTNNRLVPAPGFSPGDRHPDRAHVLAQRVGTDPYLAMQTRRGTGLYKVPSLKGVWYRGPLEHNGSVATLEDWLDRQRLHDDYVPTGWKGPFGTTARAVKGHEFGLGLTGDERKALLAFLRTL